MAQFGHKPPLGSPLRLKQSSTILDSRRKNDVASLRIVANFEALRPGRARAFYQDVLGLELLTDYGWSLN